MPATSLAFRSADMLGIGVLEFGKSPFSSFYPRRIGAKDYPSITRGSTDIAEKQLGLKHRHFRKVTAVSLLALGAPRVSDVDQVSSLFLHEHMMRAAPQL
jgi:hypothetical protein